MADAEESPSSLADLEAIAGLGNASDRDAEENAPDEQSFDLASLAASTATTPSASEPVAEDQTLDLSGLAASSLSSDAIPTRGGEDKPVVAATPPLEARSARSSFGFLYGLVAGVAVAGLLFLALRDAPQPTLPPPIPREAIATPSAQPASTSLAGAKTTPAPAVPAAPIEQGQATAVPAVAASAPKASASIPQKASPSASAAGSPRPGNVATRPDPQGEGSDPTMPPAPVVSAPLAPTTTTAAGAMDSLLDDALGSGKSSKQSKTRSTDNLMGQELPNTPSASDVTKAVQLLLPAIRGCAMGQSGVANTLLVVRGDGTVASAVITGAPYAGAASGRCMEGVLRRARFSRFQQSTFRVQFPLSIRATP